jgi:hypothetical protein
MVKEKTERACGPVMFPVALYLHKNKHILFDVKR